MPDDIRLTKRELAILAAYLSDELSVRLREVRGYNDQISINKIKNEAARINELVNKL